MKITDAMREAAKAKGRKLAGNQVGSLVEAFAEVAVAGAEAAVSASAGEVDAMAYRAFLAGWGRFDTSADYDKPRADAEFVAPETVSTDRRSDT